MQDLSVSSSTPEQVDYLMIQKLVYEYDKVLLGRLSMKELWIRDFGKVACSYAEVARIFLS